MEQNCQKTFQQKKQFQLILLLFKLVIPSQGKKSNKNLGIFF